MLKRTFIVGICLSTFALLLAKKFWEERPYTEWTREEARTLLSASPWSVEVALGNEVTHYAGVGSGSAFPEVGESAPGVPVLAGTTGESDSPPVRPIVAGANTERRYVVRLHSAAPIRMALARLAQLQGRATVEQSRQFVETVPYADFIAVAVTAPEGRDRLELEQLRTDRIRSLTYLALRKSKEKIPLERYLTPSESGGIEAIFLFPRAKDGKGLVSPAEDEIRFVTRLNPTADLNARFNVKNMRVNGKPEI